MSFRQKIQDDIKESLKAGNKDKLSAARMLWNLVKNREIDTKKESSDDEILEAVNSLAKQRRDSIEQYKLGNRQDLVDKENKDLDYLLSFLPAQMSEEQLKQIVEESIRESGAVGASDLGKVMKVLMPKVKGKADGKLVNQIVREKLGA